MAQDFYGNEYVESHWWDIYAQWVGYQRERKPAIFLWLQNTVQRLKKFGFAPQTEWGQDGASEPKTAADSVVIHIPAIGHKMGVSLSAYDYDDLTKRGRDPAASVVIAAKGYKWVEDRTKPKKKEA